VKRLTPEVLFPESEEGGQPVYGTPWPLDETFYLCVYDAEATLARGAKNNFGIYLVDAFGNKELLYRDPALSCLSPIPLKARAAPPVVPHAVLAGRPSSVGAAASAGAVVPPENPTSPDEKTGTVGLVNVYDSLKPWPAGVNIKSLRIMQVIPKTTFLAENPKIGHGFQKGARAVLGTVPVEADGSAHFRLPVGKAVYFQALDERGLAVQSMRSDTYVHPGQTLMCQGCHEPRTRAPATAAEVPLALRRPPSEIQPDVDGSNPFSYPRLVQPVLDKYCVDCHAKEPKSQSLAAGDASKNPNRWFTSYMNMKGTAFFVDGFLWNEPRTVPGKFGARASKLLAILDKGHYDVKLPPEAFHRLTLWLDANSDFYGSYENTEAQARGEIVWPSLE
ncbi:MAG: hypothetical protein IMZ65_01810, partial [Planctomycetes bacterium]|nr:hypothetical protein [Planctomycetota bacterium]